MLTLDPFLVFTVPVKSLVGFPVVHDTLHRADNERLPVPGGIPVLVKAVHDSIKRHAAVPKLKYSPDNSRFFLVDE